MGNRLKKRRSNGGRRPNKEKLRKYHHDHTRRKIRARYELFLADEKLEEIIRLIRRGRNEKVKFVGDGGKKNGAFIYLVIFCGKALPIVYNPDEGWLVTCLKTEWAFKNLPREQANELREWLRERNIREESENGN